MAISVNSGSTLDPFTGKTIHGKERMIFDYRKLNANTYKDQYSLPGINTIIKKNWQQQNPKNTNQKHH